MSEFDLSKIADEEMLELKKIAAERIEKQRIEKVKEESLQKLFSSENGDLYKELYNKGGLKEEIDKDPTVLMNPTLFRYVIKDVKSRYLESQKPSEPVVEPEKEKESTPLYQQQQPVSSKPEDQKKEIDLTNPESLLANKEALFKSMKNAKGHLTMLEINSATFEERGKVKYK